MPRLLVFFFSFMFIFDTEYGGGESFSGGERARLALALIVWKRPNVLILDEPTNHLDVEGVAWLAQHLNNRKDQGDYSFGLEVDNDNTVFKFFTSNFELIILLIFRKKGKWVRLGTAIKKESY